MPASTPCRLKCPAPNATLVTTSPTVAAAEPDLEAVQQERALDFLAHAAGDDHDEREQPRVARRAQQLLQRIVLDGVQRRREALDGEQHGERDAEARSGSAAGRARASPADRPAAEEDVARPLAVRVEEQRG